MDSSRPMSGLSIDIPSFGHGQSMHCPWASVGSPRTSHGQPVGHGQSGQSTGSPRIVHAVAMDNLWIAH
eukprot:430887-Lingulodinium_polyedra.AAC.1